MQTKSDTTTETDRCLEVMRQLASVFVQDLNVAVDDDSVSLTGHVGSWYGKQVATTAVRRLYPTHRIENKLQVITVR
jgi:hypothetical protein